MTTELFELIDQEFKNEKNFNDLSYEWLDKPVKEIEDIKIEKGKFEYPPIENIEFFDEDIPFFEENSIREIKQIKIEKDD